MPVPQSPFAFALCQPGSEKFLKAEMKRLRPDLHPAMQRPGLVSFKATGEAFDVSRPPRAVFARSWSASAGPASSPREIADLARALGAAAAWVSPRDQGPPGEVPPALEAAAEADAARLRDELSRLGVGADAPAGKPVLDVITAPGERPVVGWHVHEAGASGPGGRWDYAVPSEAPSRAYRKVVESLLFTRAPLSPGDLVLEIGAAPGGGTLAFLERGARVLAVDPRPLDAAVLARPGVTQRQATVGDLDELPPNVRWVACDAGIPPADVLAALARLRPQLRGVAGLFWTLKLVHDSDAANLQRTLARLAALSFRTPVAAQLPAHRRDLLVYARGARVD